MSITTEVKYNGTDWNATYDFTLGFPDGIVGRYTIPQSRTDLLWIPGKDDPLNFGADFGGRNIIVSGSINKVSHSELLTALKTLANELWTVQSAGDFVSLIFGDDPNYAWAATPVSFDVRFIGSQLLSTSAYITVTFLTKKDLAAVPA